MRLFGRFLTSILKCEYNLLIGITLGTAKHEKFAGLLAEALMLLNSRLRLAALALIPGALSASVIDHCLEESILRNEGMTIKLRMMAR